MAFSAPSLGRTEFLAGSNLASAKNPAGAAGIMLISYLEWDFNSAAMWC